MSLFKIHFSARGDGEETVKLKSDARKEWLRVILRTRVNTSELKKRIDENNIFLCELHFKPELISQHAKRKTSETGAVPTENLPSKSHDSKPSSRRSLVREISDETPSTSALPLVDICKICKCCQRKFCSTGLHQHTEYLTNIAKDPDDQTHPLHPSDVVRHSIPKSVEMDTNFGVLAVFPCVTCQVLVRRQDQGDVICEPCKQLQRKIVAQQNRSTRQSSAPAKDKAPLTRCSADKLRATAVESRVKCSLLEAKVKSLQVQIEKDSITVSETLEKDVLTIMGGHNFESTPHMKFFWEQQVLESASASRELRDSAALILPSERVVRDYRNYFKPGAGITKENVEELKEKASKFSGIHKYVAVIMDEMKIQKNLVFDKTSGELIGFIDQLEIL
ncbi:Hypothetical predicted protein [Paramuricea clavata]|uniref:Transposable element P transposase-like RNase H domain-containing protein n=1 Tax=Paramuricea clavata TaxID=317549 RepID=A0A6S7LIQ9_PARCT|nr:Hypothetical predicted protein [Paramuricea clavata]